MDCLTFGQLKKFIDSMSKAGTDDDTPVIIKIDDNKFRSLTGDDVFTDFPSNQCGLVAHNLPNKRTLFIQI